MVLGAHGATIWRSASSRRRRARPRSGSVTRHSCAVLPSAPRWYAYPFGGEGAQETTLRRADEVLKELGYAGVFIYDSTQSPWRSVAGGGFARLNRIDCIALPPRGRRKAVSR